MYDMPILMKILKGFGDFLVRGNVMDLAVGVLIGTTVSTLVNALVKDLLTPFVAAIFSQQNFAGLAITLRGSQFLYGEFINALVAFLITVGVAYYFIVLPRNKLNERLKRGQNKEQLTPDQKLLGEIRDLLKSSKK